MTNNAQLLPLPVAEYRLSPDSKPSLYDAEQMQSYALACIEAAKPADELGSLPVVAFWTQTPTHPKYIVFRDEKPDTFDELLQDKLRRGWDVHLMLEGPVLSAQQFRDWNAGNRIGPEPVMPTYEAAQGEKRD